MSPKLTPYTFAIGSMIFTMALIQCGHSIYDHYVNHTNESVSTFLFGAFAVTGYLGYLLALTSVKYALRGDLQRNNHYAAGCCYELRRISTVLLIVSLVWWLVLDTGDRAVVSGLAGVVLFLYSMSISYRIQNYPYKVNKWFKIF